MKKRLSVLLVVSLLLMFAAHTAAGGDIEVTKAEWRADDQKLKLRAEEGNGSQTLTASYDGRNYSMTYNPDKERYEFTLEPICYADTVVINSTSGRSAYGLVLVLRNPLAELSGHTGGGTGPAPIAGTA